MSSFLKSPSGEEAVSAIEENLFTFFLTLRGFRRTVLHDETDALWYRTDIPFPMFNGVTRARFSGEDADRRVGEIVEAYRRHEMPILWWLTPASEPDDLAARLPVHGLAGAGSMAGMAIDLKTLDARVAPPTGVTIRRVDTDMLVRQWVKVCAEASGFPAWVRKPLLEFLLHVGLDSGPMRHYLAFFEGEPIATSTVLFGAGVAGIYNVGTLPAARGKGIGGAISLAPLLAAHDLGYQVGILHASPMGLPVYRRLGFEEYCQIELFMLH